ncbi:hypothetical protein NQD34_002066 [Periophthalmus magnuspinnatus]|nr:hypothetical protein NQD34_002066 [Periophthalmus magnuspinnatus]
MRLSPCMVLNICVSTETTDDTTRPGHRSNLQRSIIMLMIKMHVLGDKFDLGWTKNMQEQSDVMEYFRHHLRKDKHGSSLIKLHSVSLSLSSQLTLCICILSATQLLYQLIVSRPKSERVVYEGLLLSVSVK